MYSSICRGAGGTHHPVLHCSCNFSESEMIKITDNSDHATERIWSGALLVAACTGSKHPPATEYMQGCAHVCMLQLSHSISSSTLHMITNPFSTPGLQKNPSQFVRITAAAAAAANTQILHLERYKIIEQICQNIPREIINAQCCTLPTFCVVNL